ncbi:TetR/AcrR family transcriptional regulator [Mycobacterium aquaticum]|uniref:TetR family transcriptional regulator n=1 Tax=Mycobacterium aquaticum TaxID=1927124 RepID=A0A1X0B001_9MYCO|nr:TetR/AcrR family transcriptional regulator [Mycobacterium aquaticum]ORA35662.1 TetR family transcriptional regulator [Mycobacterium aquaticum]
MARPREFNENDALAAARDQFWRDGYAGTSLDDLTRATGMGRGSLYATFEDKHTLFVRALESYCQGALARVITELRGDGVASALDGLVNHIRNDSRRGVADTRRRGCFMAKSAAEKAPQDTDVAKLVKKTFDAYRREVTAAIITAQRDGDLAETADPDALAALILATLRGLEAMRKLGAAPATLSAAADQLVAVLPITTRAA